MRLFAMHVEGAEFRPILQTDKECVSLRQLSRMFKISSGSVCEQLSDIMEGGFLHASQRLIQASNPESN